ncbi:MAG: ribonuclease J [Oscillospiraceae bacterium]|nr:ribonuclease J [Oscillospiraceae bacterium]
MSETKREAQHQQKQIYRGKKPIKIGLPGLAGKKDENNRQTQQNSTNQANRQQGQAKNNQPARQNQQNRTSSNGNAAANNNANKFAQNRNFSSSYKKQNQSKKQTQNNEVPVKISFLGGLNEIGKNITLFECNDEILILDCGMAFPDGEMLGVDLVIPDFTYVEQNKDKIKGLVITHAHEDHIGSIPYLLGRVNVPVYGTELTIGLLHNKLREFNLHNSAKLNVVEPGKTVDLGVFKAEFITVNHSIPGAVAIALHTPAGLIVHTGDFKIDFTPQSGNVIDLARFATLGQEKVLALMADSTNAERSGYTSSEAKVGQSLDLLFNNAKNDRIIIASFASNISRVQQIINCAAKHGRKVAYSGRSMINYMGVAKELGYLDVPDNVIIDLDMLNKYPPEQVVLVTTGSQGEPMSALSRMAYSDHRKVNVGPGDLIIISANPIPGNERTVGNVVDELLKKGCKVIYESMYEVHVSGHACREELKIIQSLVKPKFFIPVHGEQKHLRKHAQLALDMGIPKENIFIGDVGSSIELRQNSIKEVAKVHAGKVFVDGLGVGDVGSIVLRDRKHLGQDGLIIIVASLDVYDGHVVSGPDIVSRGFVYVRESEGLLDEIKALALQIMEGFADKKVHDWILIKNKIKDDVAKLITQRTRRSPMILPILMEV